MTIADLNLDYYSGFEGETEIRFYTNPKNLVFQLNRIPNASGGYSELQLQQGEYGILFFSMWDGYFHLIEEKLFYRSEYNSLPKFLRDSNEVKGWAWIDINPALISNQELEWLIISLTEINNELMANEQDRSYWNFDCISAFITFLELVKRNDMELRVSKE